MRIGRLKMLVTLGFILASWSRPLLGQSRFHLNHEAPLEISSVEIFPELPVLEPINLEKTNNLKLPNGFPCDGTLTSEFGWRSLFSKKGRMHKGIDIGAPVGTPVKATAEGTVVFSGHKGGYGLTVIVQHDDGIQTLFGHNSELSVKEGDAVQKGQEISKVGNTGHSTGPHLHYEVLVNGEHQNPAEFI